MNNTLISIKNLEFSYNSGKEYSLKIESLEIKEGEIIALIGTNGAGKTSFLSILAGILTPQKGDLEINEDLFSLISIGLLLDESKNGLENIKRTFEIFDINYTNDDLKKTAEYTEISDKKLAQNVKTYSTGMKSRIAFAPLILIQKKVYLIDEIMAVGDIKFSSKSYQTLVQKIKNDKSCTVICTHSISTVLDIATKVIWLEKGKIVEVGNPNDICNKYNEYLKSLTLNQINKKYLNKSRKALIKIEKYGDDKLRIFFNVNFFDNTNFVVNISRLNGYNIFTKNIEINNKEYSFEFSIEGMNDQYLIFSLFNHKNDVLSEKIYEINRGNKALFGNPLFYLNNVTT